MVSPASGELLPATRELVVQQLRAVLRRHIMRTVVHPCIARKVQAFQKEKAFQQEHLSANEISFKSKSESSPSGDPRPAKSLSEIKIAKSAAYAEKLKLQAQINEALAKRKAEKAAAAEVAAAMEYEEEQEAARAAATDERDNFTDTDASDQDQADRYSDGTAVFGAAQDSSDLDLKSSSEEYDSDAVLIETSVDCVAESSKSKPKPKNATKSKPKSSNTSPKKRATKPAESKPKRARPSSKGGVAKASTTKSKTAKVAAAKLIDGTSSAEWVRAELKSRGIDASGTEQEAIERLAAAVNAEIKEEGEGAVEPDPKPYNIDDDEEFIEMMQSAEPQAEFLTLDQTAQMKEIEAILEEMDAEDIKLLGKAYDFRVEHGMERSQGWFKGFLQHWRVRKEDEKSAASESIEALPIHSSGSARSEGFYHIKAEARAENARKMDYGAEKNVGTDVKSSSTYTPRKHALAKQVSRDARASQRRVTAQIDQQDSEMADSDLLKFSALKARKKQLRFGRSGIHGWGLFSMEEIGPDEMVIEYVGEVIRQAVADAREMRYEQMGMGSSYLFRVDAGHSIDATSSGYLARFMNHCCDPNCYARVIQVDGQPKIVIYSKKTIFKGDEITYDYKFPIEEEKIPCTCGHPNCRKFLN